MTAGEIIRVLQAFEEDKEVEMCDPFHNYHKIWKLEVHENPDKKVLLVFILDQTRRK